MNWIAIVYLAGVAVALAVMRDPWPERVATALVWPLGPLAFIVLVPILVISAAILWPVPVIGGLLVLGGLVWLLFFSQ